MRYRRLIALALLCLTLIASVLVCRGQSRPYSYSSVGRRVTAQDWNIYRGNTDTVTVIIALADSLKAVTDTAFYAENGRPLPASLQPVSLRNGRVIRILFTTAQTRVLPLESYLEVRVGANVQAVFRVLVSKNTVMGKPASLTLIDTPGTVINVVGGNTGMGRMGSIRRFYDLVGMVNGQVLEHNGNSRLVRGEFFPVNAPSDDYQDDLWRAIYVDENHVRIRGPAGESFTGTMVLTIFQKPITNQ